MQGIYAQEFVVNQDSYFLGNGCYQVIPDIADKWGSIWHKNKIDLSNPFDLFFTMSFGTNDANGADGACFVLHNDPNGLSTVGTNGGWLGAGAIMPMLGVEFDIWDNGAVWDEVGLVDHIGVFRDGNNRHNNAYQLHPPVEVQELETGADFRIRITWEPSTQLLTVYLECAQVLQLNYNIIDSIFGGNSLVYWGFTGASGWFHTPIIACGLQSLPDTLQICYGDSVQVDGSFYNSTGYLWNPLAGVDNPVSATTYLFPSTSTMYTMSYFDLCGQIRTDSVYVEVLPLPSVDLGPDTAICSGESLVLDAGTSGVSYDWLPNGETSQTITVSTPGNYEVTVTGANSCQNTDDINLVVNPLPNAAISGNMNICFNDSTLLTASGGDSYIWSTGDTDTAIFVAPANDSIYFVTVTDTITGCSNVATDTVNVIPLPVPQINGDFYICLRDTAMLIASGGDDYLWNTGDNNDTIYISPIDTTLYSVLVTDTVTGCKDSITDTVFVKPLPFVQIAGDTTMCFSDSVLLVANSTHQYLWSTMQTSDSIYVSPVADSTFVLMGTDTITNCSDYDTLTMTVFDLPQITITPDTAICNGNSVDLLATGGVSYHWGPNIALTDINVSNPTASPEFTVTYTVTVTNSNGCVDSADVTVTVNDLPSFFLDGDSVTCNGYADGAAWVSYTGGSTPYSYLWNTGSTDTVLTGLSGGTYTVTVTNVYGCTSVKSIYIHEPAVLDDSIIVSDLLCYHDSSGAISLIMTGGTQPYVYSWDNGMTTANISGLPAGAYSVTVTDNNYCKLTIVEINVHEPDSLVASTNADDVSCYSYLDGSAYSVVSGGTLPYSYLWSTGDTNSAVNNVGSGLYYLTVTDLNNCKAYDTVFVNQPEELIISDSLIVQPGCFESSDGKILPKVSGGIKPYNYLWSNNEITDSIVNLYGGNYSLTVTDYNQCEATYSWILTNPSETCLLIPNLFTPNGDSYNDIWEIKGIEYYPEARIEVYNRWGDMVFSSDSYYSNPWDGTINGKNAPLGSYIYIIDLKNGSEPIQGIVSIKR
ncbi:MAG: hypothetical protein Kow0068_02550 [Marinilabiliales bacterium]